MIEHFWWKGAVVGVVILLLMARFFYSEMKHGPWEDR